MVARPAHALEKTPITLTNRPSHDAVRKSMDESNTTPKPWLATLTDVGPDPSVSMSLPTKPATDPVPYVI